MLTLTQIASALGGDVSSNQVLAPGPGHSPKDRSLSITIADNQDGFVCHSFAGDDAIRCKDYIRSKLGLPEFKPNGKCNGIRHHPTEDEIAKSLKAAIGRTAAPAIVEAVYDYTDADGTLLYQVLRMRPKAFRYRRPDGNGGWLDGRGDRIVPYHLPDLLKYPDNTIFVCEGEKDADRVSLLGFCATNVASGGWSQCADALAARDVIILQDNDAVGVKRAAEAAAALQGKAKTIRVVVLPGAKDVSAWLDLGTDNAGKFERICFDTPLWGQTTKAVNGSAALSIDHFYAAIKPRRKKIGAPSDGCAGSMAEVTEALAILPAGCSSARRMRLPHVRPNLIGTCSYRKDW
jgi:hypothetical protein